MFLGKRFSFSEKYKKALLFIHFEWGQKNLEKVNFTENARSGSFILHLGGLNGEKVNVEVKNAKWRTVTKDVQGTKQSVLCRQLYGWYAM